jgi:hypothetical protein
LAARLLRRLTLLPEYKGIFAERDGFTVTDLYLALGDELRLFDEVGLDFKIDRGAVAELVQGMPGQRTAAHAAAVPDVPRHGHSLAGRGADRAGGYPPRARRHLG